MISPQHHLVMNSGLKYSQAYFSRMSFPKFFTHFFSPHLLDFMLFLVLSNSRTTNMAEMAVTIILCASFCRNLTFCCITCMHLFHISVFSEFLFDRYIFCIFVSVYFFFYQICLKKHFKHLFNYDNNAITSGGKKALYFLKHNVAEV